MPGFGDVATWPKCAQHPGDPRTDSGDDELTADQARELAQDEADRDGYCIAWWLNNHAIDEHTGPADLASVRERIALGEPCTASELLALAFNDSDRAGYCLHLLREQYRAHHDTVAQIKGRAAEILAAQEEAAEVERIERLAELHAEAV